MCEAACDAWFFGYVEYGDHGLGFGLSFGFVWIVTELSPWFWFMFVFVSLCEFVMFDFDQSVSKFVFFKKFSLYNVRILPNGNSSGNW